MIRLRFVECMDVVRVFDIIELMLIVVILLFVCSCFRVGRVLVSVRLSLCCFGLCR